MAFPETQLLLVTVAAVLARNQELLFESGAQVGDERERFGRDAWPGLRLAQLSHTFRLETAENLELPFELFVFHDEVHAKPE